MNNNDKLIIANWKMNLFYKNAFIFCKKIILNMKNIKNNFIICPPSILLSQLNITFKNINFGAQDCHYKNSGAFTGDISPLMLKKIKCKYVIIGHSERREYHHEDNKIIKEKIFAALKNNLIPIICIGENLNVKKRNATKGFISKQLNSVLPKNNKKKIIIAYEPIWAIGSGKTPSLEEISDLHIYIKKVIVNLNSSYKNTKILYGGSVNKKNSINFLKNINIDGLLVGGASLNFNSFYSILKI